MTPNLKIVYQAFLVESGILKLPEATRHPKRDRVSIIQKYRVKKKTISKKIFEYKDFSEICYPLLITSRKKILIYNNNPFSIALCNTNNSAIFKINLF